MDYSLFAKHLANGRTVDEAALAIGLVLKEAKKIAGYGVYFLCDPRDRKAFYFGKGKNKRWSAHFREWLHCKIVNARKHERIGEIVKSGLEPIAYILTDCLTETAALELEKKMIREVGRDKLTNSLNGRRSEDTILLLQVIHAMRCIRPFSKFSIPKSVNDVKDYEIDILYLMGVRDRCRSALGLEPIGSNRLRYGF